MVPLCYAAKFDPFLSLDCARVEGEFCHLATMQGIARGLQGEDEAERVAEEEGGGERGRAVAERPGKTSSGKNERI